MGDKFANKLKKAQQRSARELKTSFIPPQVAINPKLGDHGKEGNYKMIFAHYNHGQCELNKVRKFKPLIDKFNTITQSNHAGLPIRDKILSSGNYKNLFSKLPPDVDELEEIKFAETGRIFFFRVSTYLCVVAILALHR